MYWTYLWMEVWLDFQNNFCIWSLFPLVSICHIISGSPLWKWALPSFLTHETMTTMAKRGCAGMNTMCAVLYLAAKKQRAGLLAFMTELLKRLFKSSIVILTMHAKTLNLMFDIGIHVSIISLAAHFEPLLAMTENNTSVGLLSGMLKDLEEYGWWCQKRRAVIMTRCLYLLSSRRLWIGLWDCHRERLFFKSAFLWRHTGIWKGLNCSSIQINRSLWICY